MSIHPDILRGSIPRLGSVTCGRAETTLSRKGVEVPDPQRTKGLCLHTNSDDIAAAILETFGGTHHTDSPTWAHDIELPEGEGLPVLILPAGFRQDMMEWRAAECVRRCDGVTMSTVDGKRVDGTPCMCAHEMQRGATERRCSPHTVAPVLLDLDVERFGVWEIRSTGWGSARRLKGAVEALWIAGATRGQVPGVLTVQMVATRDPTGKVRNLPQLDLAIAAGPQRLALIAATAAGELGPSPTEGIAALGAGDGPTADARAEADEVRARAAILDDWHRLRERAEAAGVIDYLKAAWQEMFPDAERFGDLDLGQLTEFLIHARDTVVTAEDGPVDDATVAVDVPCPACLLTDDVVAIGHPDSPDLLRCDGCDQEWVPAKPSHTDTDDTDPVEVSGS